MTSPAAFAAGFALPHNGLIWLVARLMLDAAGSLFGLYLAIAVVLSLSASVMRFRRRIAASALRART